MQNKQEKNTLRAEDNDIFVFCDEINFFFFFSKFSYNCYVYVVENAFIPLSDATRINMCKAMGEFHLTRKKILERASMHPDAKKKEIDRLIKVS